MSLILASGSPTRRMLLQNAGLTFETVPAQIDERAAEQPLLETGASLPDVAGALAMAKALIVSEKYPQDLVIGADQLLELDGVRLTKPVDMEAARRQLLALSGRTHELHSAVACARGGAVIWHDVHTSSLTMRRLDPGYVGRHLALVGPSVLGSVGAYQLEGPGIQLFERIEGDYFAILGIPLLPLLGLLRDQGVIE